MVLVEVDAMVVPHAALSFQEVALACILMNMLGQVGSKDLTGHQNFRSHRDAFGACRYVRDLLQHIGLQDFPPNCISFCHLLATAHHHALRAEPLLRWACILRLFLNLVVMVPQLCHQVAKLKARVAQDPTIPVSPVNFSPLNFSVL